MRSSRAFLASAAVAALILGALAQAQAPRAVELDALMRAFASMPGLEARFVEEKTMSLLAVPLKSEGSIYFSPPGHLLRRIESPKPAELLVSGGTLRIRENGREQELDLASRADVRPLVESLLWIFTGNRQALEAAFHVRFEPGETWALALRPRRAPLDKLIDEIRLMGEGLAVRTVEVRERSGDRSLMRIVDANPRRTFDAKEKKRLFGGS
jgi:outer membrane lipoprotein-sorting protein